MKIEMLGVSDIIDLLIWVWRLEICINIMLCSILCAMEFKNCHSKGGGMGGEKSTATLQFDTVLYIKYIHSKYLVRDYTTALAS